VLKLESEKNTGEKYLSKNSQGKDREVEENIESI
jgi:hypothetical protein